MDVLTTAVQVSILGGAIWSVISYIVLKPIDNSINRLEKSIDKIDGKTDEINRRSYQLERELAVIDQRARSAHHRLDDMTKFFQKKYEDFPERKDDKDENNNHYNG